MALDLLVGSPVQLNVTHLPTVPFKPESDGLTANAACSRPNGLHPPASA